MKLRLGIFDSGIGGFSVLNSLLSTRTDVEVIYLADVARNPYGEKDNKEIRNIAIQISNWFKELAYEEYELTVWFKDKEEISETRNITL